MTWRDGRFELGAEEMEELLDELDRRLKARGASASVFIVGGAAIALGGIRDDRRSADIDAIGSNPDLAEEVLAIAAERGIPPTWLNGRAGMWMPPIPADRLAPRSEPGLHVQRADDRFLLATKLTAQRTKDYDDIIALARRVGLGSPASEELEALIREYYTDEEALEIILGGPDINTEIRYLAQDAARAINAAARPRLDEPEPASTTKTQRGKTTGRSTPGSFKAQERPPSGPLG